MAIAATPSRYPVHQYDFEGFSLRNAARHLFRAFSAEQDRFFLWLPVLFGAGIALYFWLPSEPSLGLATTLAVLSLLLALVWRRGFAGLVVPAALLAISSGFLAIKLATHLSAAPVLERPLRGARLTGWIELIEPRPDASERITIRVAAIDTMHAGLTPFRVRVRAPASPSPLHPGAGIEIVATLLPPGGPVLPGAYDFARAAYFRSLGAVGYARSPPTPHDIAAPAPWSLRVWSAVERLRQRIGRRVVAALPGETGAIANALLTGERGAITEATNAAYRDSGIIHILSISGLHMTVFAGAVYFAARLLLALLPGLALRYQIKKWAAVIGIVGTYGYLLISGGTPPAVRSAIMLSVMFLAVLLDRPALALRNVAIAALLILIVTPQSLIDVGFQMSFAAVVALIAGVEAWTNWRRQAPADERPARRWWAGATAFLAGISLTTLIATVAVAPFGAYYFHKSTQFGILANMLAVPACNLIVMPSALAALIAMPFGLEAWPLNVMAIGIDIMSAVAVWVAALPGAVVLVPAISSLAFALMIAGGAWLTLWAGRWRLAGLAPILAGIVLAPTQPRPDVLVAGNAGLVAVRGPDGRLAAFQQHRRSSFELSRWLEHDADPRQSHDVGPGQVFACDPLGCTARIGRHALAITLEAAALADDCRRVDLLIWLEAGDQPCGVTSRPTVITRDALRRAGTHAIYVRGTTVSIETTAANRGNRPWSGPLR